MLSEAQCELIAIDGASKERGEACLRIGREVRMQRIVEMVWPVMGGERGRLQEVSRNNLQWWS